MQIWLHCAGVNIDHKEAPKFYRDPWKDHESFFYSTVGMLVHCVSAGNDWGVQSYASDLIYMLGGTEEAEQRVYALQRAVADVFGKNDIGKTLIKKEEAANG